MSSSTCLLNESMAKDLDIKFYSTLLIRQDPEASPFLCCAWRNAKSFYASVIGRIEAEKEQKGWLTVASRTQGLWSGVGVARLLGMVDNNLDRISGPMVSCVPDRTIYIYIPRGRFVADVDISMVYYMPCTARLMFSAKISS
jgi:hypothetical protein